jgi:hypothetical protein
MQSTTAAAEPADCLVHARHLGATVERLRVELGRPRDPRPALTVAGASPRECWFAALALHRRAARLAEEHGGDPSAALPHPPPVDQIRPGHVLQVIQAACDHLAEVRRAVGGGETDDGPSRNSASTPSDVLGVLLSAGRQLDRLLARPLSPGDVFEQVALAVAYASRLTGSEPLAAPAFERAKAPSDCYQALAGVFDAARALIRRAGKPVLDAAPPAGEPAQIVPSDCFDLATLVLGELAFLHALAPDANPPAPYELVRAGRKLPAHVFQQVGALRAQVDRLAR